jgi:hypothetical protein
MSSAVVGGCSLEATVIDGPASIEKDQAPADCCTDDDLAIHLFALFQSYSFAAQAFVHGVS